ncbi:GPI-anchored CFEM domain protein A-like isoform X2 [Camellia sinensis]|uniref:GPI-anchored CFEM domain protein A-like isoform X2 n=1 Tax=Camellia sinensis TaxID=4442 RepID=UPI001035E9CB|nr:GPI-anchored CFEM domain protein A-like isoform X2 [Camellia sinensis]
MWTLIPGDPLQPPPLKRLPGRPRTSRKRAAHEPPAGTSQTKRSSTLRCKWCMQFGHNKRTCQRGPVRGEASAAGRGSGTSSGRGSGKTDGTSSGRGSAKTTGRGSGRSVSRGRGRDNSSGRGSSAKRGNASGRGNSSGRDSSAGRGNTTTRGSSAGKGSSSGRGKGKANHAQDIPRGTPPMPAECVTQVTQHHVSYELTYEVTMKLAKLLIFVCL